MKLQDSHETLLAKFSATTGPPFYLPQLEDASKGSAIELQAHRALLKANGEAKAALLTSEQVIMIVLYVAQQRIRERTSLYDVRLVQQC